MSNDAASIAAEIVSHLVEAWNAHNAARCAGAFHESAEFTNVFGARATGRAAIQAMHAPIFEGIFKQSVFVAGSLGVRQIRDDVIAVDIPWTMRGHVAADGSPLPERHGLLNVILTREDRWAVLVSHNADFSTGTQALRDAPGVAVGLAVSSDPLAQSQRKEREGRTVRPC